MDAKEILFSQPPVVAEMIRSAAIVVSESNRLDPVNDPAYNKMICSAIGFLTFVFEQRPYDVTNHG